MRIVLLGKGERGKACLKALRAAGWDVVCVVVPSDERDGWAAHGAMGVRSINTVAGRELLADQHPDLLVLAGYSEILRSPTLKIPARGVINTHGGRLPQYRGSSVLNWQIIRGEPQIGISVIAVDAGVDTGDVLAESSRPLGPDETIREVVAWTLEEFPRLIVEVCAAIQGGTLVRRPQDPSLARVFAHRTDEDGGVDWQLLTAVEVHDRVRALTRPYPGAWASIRGGRMRIWRSRLLPTPVVSTPGKVALRTVDGVAAMARDCCVELLDVQPPGSTDVLPARALLDRGDWLR